MKKLLLSLALVGALVAPATGQVNVVPQTGLTTAYLPKATYSAGFIGLAPAASATDVICISGSASKTVAIQKIVVSGSAGTLVTLPLALIRRASLDSSGTAASTTANPANTITKLDTSFATATAVPISYTANPTINDSAGTILAARSLTLPVTSAGVVSAPAEFDFTNNNSNLLSPLILRGVAQQVCVNFTGVSVSSGVVNGQIVWTEY